MLGSVNAHTNDVVTDTITGERGDYAQWVHRFAEVRAAPREWCFKAAEIDPPLPAAHHSAAEARNWSNLELSN